MKKETKLWYDLAKEDFTNMKIMTKSKSWRAAVFFAQQAVEKLLKAYIIEYKHKVPRKTHRIELLLEDAGLVVEEIKEIQIEELSKAYVWVRYPDLSDKFYIQKEATQELLTVSEKLYQWAKNKFKNN